MSYLANFQNDVFISYAHVDNAVRNQLEKGWVSHFYSELNFWLTQRVGRSDKFKIWLDDRLSSNDVFTDKIKDAIKNSALLITFSSNAYYASEYCLDELKWFYENTSKANPGLIINNKSRIYNIRLNNIEYAQWPKECQGTTGYEMFVRPDNGREGLGFPVTPGSEKFTKNIQGLADDIYTTLTELKKQENEKPEIVVIDNEFTQIQNKNIPSIFISYAHEDESWKNKLIKHLSVLKNQELIDTWNDREIKAGFWEPQIETAMENSNIFLLIITSNFLSSKYIASKEITKAYSLFKAGKAKIFPIICDSCDWQLQPITKSEKEFYVIENKEIYMWLGKFQSFPKNGKPIKNWSNQQDGFLDVINQLKKNLY